MTRALKPDEKRVYDVLVRTKGCTRYYLEIHLPMTVKEIQNVLRRLSRHGYAKTGWTTPASRTRWFAALPSEQRASMSGLDTRFTRAHLEAAARRAPFSSPHCCHCFAPASPLGGNEFREHSIFCPETVAQAERELKALERR